LQGNSGAKVYRKAIIRATVIVLLVGAVLGIVVAILQGHGTSLLVLSGLALWLTAVVCVLIPPYRWRSFAYRYFWRQEEDGGSFFEVGRCDRTLCRRIRVIDCVVESRDVIENGDALEQMADLTASSARAFARHWTQRSAATRLFALQLRMSGIAVVNCALCLILWVVSPSGPIRGAALAWDITVGTLLIGGMLFGGLQAIAAIVLQFMKPSVVQRVIALGVASLIPMAIFITVFVLSIPVC